MVVIIVVVLQFICWIALLTERNKLHFKCTFCNEERIELNINHLFVCIGGTLEEINVIASEAEDKL